MSKKLGPVDPEPPPVDPQKNKAEGLGVIVSREVTIKPTASQPGLGTVKNDAVVVSVAVAPPDPIGQVRQVVMASPTPPPPPPPVGVVQDRTPVVSATPMVQGASPLGVIHHRVTEVAPPPPPVPVGAVLQEPPTYPPPPPTYKGDVGTVNVPVVHVVQTAPSNEPQKVVTPPSKPKSIIEQPVEISPFKNPDE